MIPRTLQQTIEQRLQEQAAVAIVGPRQVGKTTLALELGKSRDAVYLDLEDPEQRARLSEPQWFFEQTKSCLVVLDEIHRMPHLFEILRGVIDRGRREGYSVGRFLLLGSASIDLLRQSGETLAGRISFLELPPLQLSEVIPQGVTADELWRRGGFPGSLLATTDQQSMAWRRDFIRTYLEREVSTFGGRMPVETLGRLWAMVAHRQGSLLNASELARSLGVSSQSVARYIDLLVDLLLLRRLTPFHANVGKRLVKAPKLYIRDTGILHALLGIDTAIDLGKHPVIGASWEGFVIETLMTALSPQSRAYFYRTAAGAEIDLLIETASGELWAIEVKRSISAPARRGFHESARDLGAKRSIVIHGGTDRFALPHGVEALDLESASLLVSGMSN